tara:strand:- start:711 stop:2912 length:2202 start_codon:yes stop_codon:yes gene_type:complete
MIKLLSKTLLYIVIILLLIIFYLSFFGINTNKFNDKIKKETLNINKKINLELESINLELNIRDLTINAKTNDSKIVIGRNKLELAQVSTNIPLKSIINREFLIDDLKISTKEIKIKDLILLVRSFQNSAELLILDSAIKEGNLIANIYLNFDNKGNVKDDYEVNGFIKNGQLGLTSLYNIKNLDFLFKIKKDEYFLNKLKTNFNKIKLSSTQIKIKKKKNLFLINGDVISKERNFGIEESLLLFKKDYKNLNIKNIKISSSNNFSFSINKKLKINDLNIKSKIDLNELVYRNDLLEIKKYLPDFKELIKLKDHKIIISYKKDKLDITGKGKIVIDDKVDILDYVINKKNDQYIFNTKISFDKNLLSIDSLQYKKKEQLNSILKLIGIYKKNNQTEFSLISFIENDNTFLINDLKLNNKFNILDFKKIELNYINNNNIKNFIKIKKNKKNYEIDGTSLDLTNLIDDILINDDNNSKSMFNNLNSSIKINIDKIYLEKDVFVNDIKGYMDFKSNKIDKLYLVSTFPNKKKLNLTINTNKENEKITTIYSNHPKPLVKKYEFIKGFEEGVLDFYSVKKGDETNSLLTIKNFKIKEVPVFAKLLSLASLQGIADLLTGEGIRFTSFEMKFSNKKGLMNIEELYSIGPAVSILMDGYIESKKLISLNGTLVPATTINKTIALIPVIGNILVGEKSGDGVFGVSFKIKGKPGKLKTTVNPIKTLTPRFITRTLEKIKKN